MQFVKRLPDVEEIVSEYPLTEVQREERYDRIREIRTILSGGDSRKILLIGPCSADREDAVLEYVSRLRPLQDKVVEKFLIIPRVYTSKPRTKGIGYKGFLHRPDAANEHDDLMSGVIATRHLHRKIIQETGMYCVDEMLYPETMYYYLDLLAYVAIGARSVEDQEHRLLASGLDVPVGMKNPISGDMHAVLNAVSAAQHGQSLIYRDWVVRTEGNPFAHAILRGYLGNDGHQHPNYHYEDLSLFFDIYQKAGVKNNAVIIDCNHGNSDKHYEEQVRISQEVIESCRRNESLNGFVKGLMIESYLEDGKQMVGAGVFGKSITDGCLGWDKTEKLIRELAEKI